MTRTTKAQRDELRLLHAEATPAPWAYDDGVTDGDRATGERGKYPWVTTKDGNKLICQPEGDADSDRKEHLLPSTTEMDGNGDLIAKSRNALPALLADLDAAEAHRDRAESELDAMRKARTEAEAAATRAEAERDEALALIEAARVDVRAESFLEHAQAILAKCVAPYSCEQMKAVADVLASNFRKLELVRELADKVTEQRDDARAKMAALVEIGERWVKANEPIDADSPFTDHDLKAAIAAARGGATP